MDTDTELVEALRKAAAKGDLVEAQPYSRSELVEILAPVLGDNEQRAWSAFADIRTAAETGDQIGDVRLAYFGNKRGRRYTFSNLRATPEVASSQPAPGALGGDAADVSGNDHPEDRAHLAAHVALLLKRRCVGVSMPKVAGKKKLGGASHNENPDIIGIATNRRAVMPTVTTELPSWFVANARRDIITTIGAEVKPEIAAGNALYWAVVEARHNSRYFDEAWLVSQIPASLHADARDLGEEYNVGILSWEAGMQSDVLWSPSRRSGTRTIGDFFARFEQCEAEARLSELKRCQEISTELPHTLRRAALEQLVSNQLATSMVRRLPATVQTSLRSHAAGAAAQDLETYCSALVDLFLEAYQHDSGEDATISEFWKELDLSRALKKNGDFVSAEARKRVLNLIETVVKERAHDAEAVRAAFANA